MTDNDLKLYLIELGSQFLNERLDYIKNVVIKQHPHLPHLVHIARILIIFETKSI